jgi:hypothetical protein
MIKPTIPWPEPDGHKHDTEIDLTKLDRPPATDMEKELFKVIEFLVHNASGGEVDIDSLGELVNRLEDMGMDRFHNRIKIKSRVVH